MKVLGLTGGIGAGKTAVAHLFEAKGIPVFNSDTEAKKVYTSSTEIQAKVTQLLGGEAYIEGSLNKKFVAKKVFSDAELLKQLNAIIHPALKQQFNRWKEAQNSAFVVKEAAILFESQAYKQCDAVLTVTASEGIRKQRVMQRDQISEEEVLKRMQNQWQENRKIELSDFVIHNNKDFKSLQQEFDGLFGEISFRLS